MSELKAEGENIIGSPTIASFDAGRSLCRDIDRLSQQIKFLYEAVGRLVDLQSEANKKLDVAIAARSDLRTAA
ncbi:MAG: hypothetical protein JWQ87_1872 [Candidatus Sulfotelmatobacter sp.]|nr:hypothetical protein [Candidatus Sulfotelmatobacter sp.]